MSVEEQVFMQKDVATSIMTQHFPYLNKLMCKEYLCADFMAV